MNVAIARLHELTSALSDAEKSSDQEGMNFARREAALNLSMLCGPFIPYMAETLMNLLEPNTQMVVQRPWPIADKSLMAATKVIIAIQIRGKLRATIETTPNMDENSVIELARKEPAIIKFLEGKTIIKTIYVPNKIVNFVVNG